jgi:hypothetical protein
LTDAQLHKKFNDFTHQAFVVAIIIGLLLILLAKFLRDGKNWARWTFVIFTVVPGLPTAYLFNITNFLYNVPATYRILSGLTGLAALAAIVFLFLKTSRPYFRKPGAGAPVSPFAALLRGRSAPRRATPATSATPTPTPNPSQPVGTAEAEATPVPARPARGKGRGADTPDSSGAVAPEAPPLTTPTVAKRPRAKSRKTAE